MDISKEEIAKLLVETKYRLPTKKDDIAVYVVDIPTAAQKIIDLIKSREQLKQENNEK
jgi:hypothetical protein